MFSIIPSEHHLIRLRQEQAAVLLQGLRYGAPNSHIIPVIRKDFPVALALVSFHGHDNARQLYKGAA